MGAGRKAARGMKAYLGLRDTERPAYLPAAASGIRRRRRTGYGIARSERGFARVHLAMNDTP
jgi:glutamate synthase (NADPH/NADH) small chain